MNLLLDMNILIATYPHNLGAWVSCIIAWLREYEFLVTSSIALFTFICAVVGLIAVRENLQNDRWRFRQLSPASKDILKALIESKWKDRICVDYAEISHLIVLEVAYRNNDSEKPYPSDFNVSSYFHFALLELLEKRMLERQERKFYLTNKGNKFLLKFEDRLKRAKYQPETCFENKYSAARESLKITAQ